MNVTQEQFTLEQGGVTQCDRILSTLESHSGDWVGIPELYQASGSFVVHSRISDLRRRGHVIENRVEHVSGKRHSFYRISRLTV